MGLGFGQADLPAVGLHGGAHLFQIGPVIEDGAAASAWLGPQSADAHGSLARDPAVDGHHATADPFGDLGRGQAFGFEQDHPAAGAEDMACAVASAFLQGGSLFVGQGEDNHSAHRELIIAYFCTIT